MCRQEYFVQTYLSICYECVGQEADAGFSPWPSDISSFCDAQATTYVETFTSTANEHTTATASILVSTTLISSYEATTATYPASFTPATLTSIPLTSYSNALTGLVTCPSRIINPTFTPAEPLPTSYLWGCPPGTVCALPLLNCNYEQNLPADTYFCPLEQCITPPPLPVLSDDIARWNEPGYNITAVRGPVGYFNLNPMHFNLTYEIFDGPGALTGTTYIASTSVPSSISSFISSSASTPPVSPSTSTGTPTPSKNLPILRYYPLTK